MENEVQKINEQLKSSGKTILLPKDSNADCYVVYSKQEYKQVNNKKLLVDGKVYKHRLYLYKKINNSINKILTFIILNPGCSNHIVQDSLVKNCIEIAKGKYDAIEIFSIFTLRTTDKIDAVSEDALLDVIRADLSKNDIVLAYGDNIKRTTKYKNISSDDLKKINKVRNIKINALLDFIFKNAKGKILSYSSKLTYNKNPRSLSSFNYAKRKGLLELTELKYSDIKH